MLVYAQCAISVPSAHCQCTLTSYTELGSGMIDFILELSLTWKSDSDSYLYYGNNGDCNETWNTIDQTLGFLYWMRYDQGSLLMPQTSLEAFLKSPGDGKKKNTSQSRETIK